jgi:hypothetical protein
MSTQSLVQKRTKSEASQSAQQMATIWTDRVQFPAGTKDFLLHNIQSGSFSKGNEARAYRIGIVTKTILKYACPSWSKNRQHF